MIYNIRGYHGGVGDQLMWSTLPELLVNRGHACHLYTGPNVEKLRNSEIKKLVWDLNPFITGTSDIDWNAGDLPDVPYVNTEDNFIKNAEAMFRLPPTNSWPKLYYEPNRVWGIDGIIELSALSLKYDNLSVLSQVSQLMAKYPKVKWKQIVSKYQTAYIEVPNVPIVQPKDIFHLCDMLPSCKILITLSSGVHSMAAAMRRVNPNFSHHCLLPTGDFEWIMEIKKFVYPDIQYLRT